MSDRRVTWLLTALFGTVACAGAGDGPRRPKDEMPVSDPEEEETPPRGGSAGSSTGRGGSAGSSAGRGGSAGSSSQGGGTGGTGGGASTPTAGAGGSSTGGRGGASSDGGAGADGQSDDAAAPPDARGDGPAPDASPDRPPVTGDPCPFQLCESFESLADGAYPGSGRPFRPGSPSRMLVDSTRAARGKKALKVTTPGTPFENYLRTSQGFPPAGGAFYGRVYFWIEKAPTNFVHWNLIEARGPEGGGGKVVRYGGIGNAGGANTWLYNIEPHKNPPGEKAKGDSGTIPLRTWHCVEWFFDASKSEARLWWNGTERTRVRYQDDWGAPYAFPEMRSIHVGWALFQTVNSDYEVWIDELVIDKAKIGCAPM